MPTKEEAATFLGISVRSLQRLTAEGLFHPVTTGTKGVAVYDQSELDSWRSLSDEEQKQARAQAKSTALVTTRPAVTTNLPQNRPLLLPSAQAAPDILPPSELVSKLLLTLAEASLLTGLSRDFLSESCRTKRLRAFKRGGWRVRPDDLRDFINGL